eukprot:gene14991-16537_t
MDKKLVGGLLASLNVPSLMFCANKCTSSQNCQTFNFKPQDLSSTASEQINCQLLSMTKESSGATLAASTGWIHYEPTVQESPRCRSVQCPAGFKCVESCTKQSGYDCVEEWLSGDGSGGTESYIGTQATKEACILECSKKSNGSVYANGATFMDLHSHCFCEFGMTQRISSHLHQSSYISPSCSSYTQMTSQDRNVDTGYGEKCDNTLPVASYRFTGPAGVKMPTSCVTVYHCKTQMPGWMEGAEPTQADGVVTRKWLSPPCLPCCLLSGGDQNVEHARRDICELYHHTQVIIMKKRWSNFPILNSLRCKKSDFRKRIPILSWLRTYNLEKFRGDLISGLAVGLLLVPQSLAIASLAGLPIQYGLYSAFPGVLVYFFLGTSKDISVGPTYICVLMASRHNAAQSPEVASLLAFVCGVVLLLAGVFRFGFIVHFISRPVLSGFMSGAIIAICVSQLKDLFGLRNSPRGLFPRLGHFFRNLKYTRLGDALLGTACIALLVVLHFVGKRQNTTSSTSEGRWKIIARKILYCVCLAKSALVVIIATIVAYLVHICGGHPDTFTLTGELPKGFPKVQAPFKEVKLSQNQTATVADTILSFGPGIAFVPLIMFIETISVAKTLGCKNGYKVDTTQELLAVGICNIFGSFFGSFPITGALARSIVNSISGAATPTSSVISGVIVILALEFITPVIKYTPLTSLAAMVIVAVVTMIDVDMPRDLWRVNRAELFPLAVAFLGCFFDLEIGFMSGVIASLLLILYRSLRPRLSIVMTPEDDHHDNDYYDYDGNYDVVTTVRIDGGLWFPGTDRLSKCLQNVIDQNQDFAGKRFLLKVDCRSVFEMDYTIAQGLRTKIGELPDKFDVKFVNVKGQHVRNVLVESELIAQRESLKASKSNDSKNCEMQLFLYESSV